MRLSGKDPQLVLPPGVAVVIGTFTSGLPLSISRQKRRRKRSERDVDLEQLENIDEVWALCCRHPRPGWRILGRFLEQDTFVALLIEDKLNIGGDYAQIAAEVMRLWNELFPGSAPYNGGSLSDYITGDHYDADQEAQRRK